MKVVLIPGDGIGPEIAQSVQTVSDALHTGIVFETYQAGADYYQKSGKLMQDGLYEAIEQAGYALKGPTATPIGTGFRSINVQIRQHFSAYANLRPVHNMPGVKTRYDNVDLVIVRENTEDLYRGIEYMYDADTAHGIKVITREGSLRIARFAFDYARSHHRHKVTCVHKANIMKLTDGMFREAFYQAAKDYPDIEANDVIVDAFCMKVVTDPSQFDVVVSENLYGDIISDLCAGLVGGLGFAPSANISETVKVYEAVHGSAPDIAGKDLANPCAILMALGMLLEDAGMDDKAQLLKSAIRDLLEEGTYRTRDLGGTAGTTAFTKALAERIESEK